MNIESDLKKMDIIIEKLKKQAEILEFKIEAREDSFSDKSEKCQESERGIAHEEKTREMQDLFDSVSSKIDTIENSIREIRELL